jgi:hypothetical protein
MQSIWSHIIWEKMGHTNETHSISTEPFENSKKLVLEYLNSLSLKEIEDIFNTLSGTKFIPETDYYDGHFHEMSQGEESENFSLHDTTFFPLILNMCCHYDIQDNEIEMLKEVVHVYRKKREQETGINNEVESI